MAGHSPVIADAGAYDMTREPAFDLRAPYARGDLIGHQSIEQKIRRMIGQGTMHNGWILHGPKGIGKATLAARIVRAVLDPEACVNETDLQTDIERPIIKQIAHFAHPDFLCVRREWDEKKERFANDISVDNIRNLSGFLNHTAAGNGWRVAVVDCADDLNRNAANALLKSLEEPPANTLILLLAHVPGRLLPTIRSRCRFLPLRPVSDLEITSWLDEQVSVPTQDIEDAVRVCGGAPGYALDLIEQKGVAVLRDAEQFVSQAVRGEATEMLAQQMVGKRDDYRWSLFSTHVLSVLAKQAHNHAIMTDGTTDGAIPDQRHKQSLAYLKAWEQLSALFHRGEKLNMDRVLMVEAAGYDLASLFKP